MRMQQTRKKSNDFRRLLCVCDFAVHSVYSTVSKHRVYFLPEVFRIVY